MLACVLLPDASVEPSRRLFAVSPLLEQQGEVVFLDVRGTSRLHGGTSGLFAAIRRALAPEEPRGLALASNRFTAEVAARYARGAVAVAPGDEALFLSRLPLAALPLSAALARRLRPLGLETLGDFASLPLAAVERRYGREGVALHRLARGEDEAGLLPQSPETQPRVLAELEAPADGLERLRPVLETLCGQLCQALEERGQGVVRLELELQLDAVEEPPTSGAARPSTRLEVAPAAPETRSALLLDLLALRLQRAPPDRPVTALSLRVLESRSLAVHQNALFGEGARDASRGAEALSRLLTTLGERTVGRALRRADHRLESRWFVGPVEPPARPRGAAPGAERPASATTLRLIERPETLVPILVGGRLAGFRRGRRTLDLARLSVPRRLEGGWWCEPWARDEYDLQTSDGALYRVCRDLCTRRWLLLGEAD